MTKRTVLDHTPDGLRQRLRDMERQIADLQRVRNPPPSYVEPAAPSGGCESESFRAAESHSGDLTGTSGYVPFNWTTAASGCHYTSGVSGMSSSSTTATVPAGLWIVSLTLRLAYFAAIANAGTISFYVVADGQFSQYAQLSPNDLANNNSATLHVTDHFWIPSGGDIRVFFSNSLNNSGTHVNPRINGGFLSASRLCDPASITDVA